MDEQQTSFIGTFKIRNTCLQVIDKDLCEVETSPQFVFPLLTVLFSIQ